MAKKRIKDIIEDMVKDFLAENQLELYNVEFLKEGKDWFLRVYIDKTVDCEQEYVGSDDCEKVSRFLSENWMKKIQSNRITIWKYPLRVWTDSC